MNISPNTKLVICQDVPLDPSYEHTIHFGYTREYQHLADQYNYFYSKRKYVFQPTTYQRVNSNKIRVQMIADNLYNCNYMMFQNTNFRTETTHYTGDKWFYAFITKVEYINNAVTEITYEMDVMQTWLFDYVITWSFVERQHSSTDGIGDNMIPETIVPTSYKTESELIWPLTAKPAVQNQLTPKAMIVATQLPAGVASDMRLITQVDGIPCHVYYQIYDMQTQQNQLDDTINNYINAGNEGAIIGLFCVPPFFTKDNAHVTTPVNVNLSNSRLYGGDFDGYTPRNNKMYTYPFNKLMVQNSFGQTKEYRIEYFYKNNDGSIDFTGKGSALPKPALIIYPQNYAGNVGNVDDALSIGEYPQGAFSGDSFQLWLHQGFIQDSASIGTSLLNFGMFSSNPEDVVGGNIGGRNVVTAIGNTIAHSLQAYFTPDKFYGNLDSTCPFYGIPAGYGFKFKVQRPVRAEAQMIDDYFTRFGYAQNRLMVVDSYTRQHWTYTKTLDCCIKGSIPADDMEKIRNVYNKGITWWINPEEIGNYNLSNPPK